MKLRSKSYYKFFDKNDFVPMVWEIPIKDVSDNKILDGLLKSLVNGRIFGRLPSILLQRYFRKRFIDKNTSESMLQHQFSKFEKFIKHHTTFIQTTLNLFDIQSEFIDSMIAEKYISMAKIVEFTENRIESLMENMSMIFFNGIQHFGYQASESLRKFYSINPDCCDQFVERKHCCHKCSKKVDFYLKYINKIHNSIRGIQQRECLTLEREFSHERLIVENSQISYYSGSGFDHALIDKVRIFSKIKQLLDENEDMVIFSSADVLMVYSKTASKEEDRRDFAKKYLDIANFDGIVIHLPSHSRIMQKVYQKHNRIIFMDNERKRTFDIWRCAASVENYGTTIGDLRNHLLEKLKLELDQILQKSDSFNHKNMKLLWNERRTAFYNEYDRVEIPIIIMDLKNPPEAADMFSIWENLTLIFQMKSQKKWLMLYGKIIVI